MTLFGFLMGETVFAAHGEDAATIFNLCMQEKIPYGKTAWDGERFLLTCVGRAQKRFAALCREHEIPFEVLRQRGLPYTLLRLGKRPGLLIGFLVAAFLLLLSRGIVWQIRVEGNVRLSEERIRHLLAENGVEVGRPLKGIKTDAVEGNILLSEKDVAWIALNVKGTTVTVEIRETERGDIQKKGAANLVARCDGRIERLLVYDGQTVVKMGDVVREGELLVSGVYDKPEGGGLRTAHAHGQVLARTMHDFSIEIPFLYDEKVYTGREWREKTLKFFAKDIKVFANTGNAPPTCDIIYYESRMSFFGGSSLPLGMDTALYREYRVETRQMSASEAAEKAFLRLSYELGALSEDAELLEKQISFEITEDAYCLRCHVTCIENIAVTQEIEIG